MGLRRATHRHQAARWQMEGWSTTDAPTHERELNLLPMFTRTIAMAGFGELNVYYVHQRSAKGAMLARKLPRALQQVDDPARLHRIRGARRRLAICVSYKHTHKLTKKLDATRPNSVKALQHPSSV
ncbi:hypothetical protein BJY52DRAFT_631397 [Lactarius psammicola]|nr:hypothetical protein BJY52DRAFT_631397 [Lactarius psammicola]